MTSLYPGLLFYSTGLNKKSTPTKPEATPSEIDHQLGRVPFNGRPWPKSSPVCSVYDVRNSSTRMIILNNKLGRRPRGSHLRGQTDHHGEITAPQPSRHLTERPKTSEDRRLQTSETTTPRFVRKFPASVPAKDRTWVNTTQRPATTFENGSPVNATHHNTCQGGPSDYEIMRWYNSQRSSRPKSRVSTLTKEEERSLSPILAAPGLKAGERKYLNHIARIYSVSDMKSQTTARYRQIMSKEISKDRTNTEITARLTGSQYGLRTYKYSDWEKYNRYLNTPRKTQFGTCDSFKEKGNRAASAPGPRSSQTDTVERPHTTQHTPRKPKTPRSSAKTPRGRDRPSTRKADKDENADDLTGKPARTESPLPLKPKESNSPSISSESDAEETSKPTAEKTEPSPDAPVESSKPESPEPETTKEDSPETETQKEELPKVESSNDESGEEVKRSESGSGSDDERSKLSAREDGEERGGDTVEYTPTSGEPGDERSELTDQVTEVEASSKETYKPTSTIDSEESSKEQSPAEEPKVESSGSSSEDISSKAENSEESSSKEKSEVEAVNVESSSSSEDVSSKSEKSGVEASKIESGSSSEDVSSKTDESRESTSEEKSGAEVVPVESSSSSSEDVSSKTEDVSSKTEDVSSKTDTSMETIVEEQSEGVAKEDEPEGRPQSQLGAAPGTATEKDNSDDGDVSSAKDNKTEEKCEELPATEEVKVTGETDKRDECSTDSKPTAASSSESSTIETSSESTVTEATAPRSTALEAQPTEATSSEAVHPEGTSTEAVSKEAPSTDTASSTELSSTETEALSTEAPKEAEAAASEAPSSEAASSTETVDKPSDISTVA